MAIKSLKGVPVNGNPLKIYTTPADKVAIIKMLIATPDKGASSATTANVTINKSYPLVSGLSVTAAAGSVKVLDDFVALSPNDDLWIENTAPSATRVINDTSLPGNIIAFLADDVGGTFVALVSGYGIYRSVDECKTWTKVFDISTVAVSYAYINSIFFFYLADGTTLSGTANGTTWSINTYANTPMSTAINGLHGRIARSSSGVYMGALSNASSALVYTSNGTTWNSLGANAPSTIKSIAWGGSYWLVLTDTAVYYIDGTLASPTYQMSNGTNLSGWYMMVSDKSNGASGAGKILLVGSTTVTRVCNDGGINFFESPGLTLPSLTMPLFIADAVLCGNGSGLIGIIKTPFTTTSSCGNIKAHPLPTVNGGGALVRNTKIYIVSNSNIAKADTQDIINNRNYGLTFHLSVAEIDVV